MAIFQWLSTFARRMMRIWAGRYRPERHYMRGAGPASKRSARHEHKLLSCGVDRGSGTFSDSAYSRPAQSIVIGQIR